MNTYFATETQRAPSGSGTPLKPRAWFEFHFCFTEPYGNECHAFDIYFGWQIPGVAYSMDLMEHGQKFSELVLKLENRFVTDDWDVIPLFDLKYCRNQKQFQLRAKKEWQRFPLRASGSGGNWYWHIFKTNARRTPHLMNWLRRLRGIDVTEWDNCFRDYVWDSRGPIQMGRLRKFSLGWVQAQREQFNPK